MDTFQNIQAFHRPEVWGGIECTINRVNDEYYDQLELSGHYSRPDDLQDIARLGITKLRYPVLWERHETVQGGLIDWTWTNAQLQHLRALNIDPIVGLVHHGSGPKYTSLADPEFPELFAAYALKVAERFPWVEYYTPVNEPLTTARFSGLYGHWFPHLREEKAFVRMLVHQIKAIVLAMQAIRSVNPEAKLIQTEDLAKIHSSRGMRYQADFENRRRWLSLDLLCGKVDGNHFFWNYLLDLDIKKEELEFFVNNPSPPDVMGFNYYLTSERYLDKRTYKYPPELKAENQWHKYADVEAVRAGKALGIKSLLAEAWDRYRIPLAITECHIHCDCEQQKQWFLEGFDACRELNAEGKSVVAITAWSLLGAFDWNSLLTKKDRHYEPGVFHLANNQPHWTPYAQMLQELSHTIGLQNRA